MVAGWAEGLNLSSMADELRTETCRIVLWRGYLRSAFYVRLDGAPSHEWVGPPSPAFRGQRSARRAHAALLSRLAAAGWTPSGQGPEWYETTLVRPIGAPAREVPIRSDPRSPRIRFDRWRAVAVGGLAVAIVFLSLVASQPS